ncbi:hypothetical protein J2S19_004843 [Metabacillus malikii]|uniref:OTU domain-containing protein n=2 Tax=Metabacillus malikii TaxID=1504265 RepID=A0ABT9ZNY4_9BACI|nr:hypothetical protein [Metabacillus malikii]
MSESTIGHHKVKLFTSLLFTGNNDCMFRAIIARLQRKANTRAVINIKQQLSKKHRCLETA